VASSIQMPLTFSSVPETARAKFCDTLDIDHVDHVLYAGDNWSAGVDVFDITDPKPRYVTTIGIRGRIYGIAVAKNVGKVFVGVSGSIVAVIDMPEPGQPYGVSAQIETGGRDFTDLVDYEPMSKTLVAANHLDGFMVFIDATTNVVVGRVEGLGSGLEQPRFNAADGLVYLTNYKGNVLHQLDPQTHRLVNTFEIADACHPTGLAINPQINRALLVSSNRDNPHTVIWDLDQQRIESVFPESGCGDGAIYEPAIDRFFVANAGFSGGPVIGVFGGNPIRFLANVPTAQRASWVTYDRRNKLVYAPTIENGKPAILSFSLPGPEFAASP
jgi:DNA-binding beta-propeller fold protein YncE